MAANESHNRCVKVAPMRALCVASPFHQCYHGARTDGSSEVVVLCGHFGSGSTEQGNSTSVSIDFGLRRDAVATLTERKRARIQRNVDSLLAAPRPFQPPGSGRHSTNRAGGTGQSTKGGVAKKSDWHRPPGIGIWARIRATGTICEALDLAADPLDRGRQGSPRPTSSIKTWVQTTVVGVTCSGSATGCSARSNRDAKSRVKAYTIHRL